MTYYEVILPSKYAGKTYLIDGKNFAETRSQTAFAYQNSLEQYIKLKSLCPEWKTELDLFYLWGGSDWTSPQKDGNSLFLLVPSTKIPTLDRHEIIHYGLKESYSDMTLLLRSDLNSVKNKNYHIYEAGEFVLLSNAINDFAKKTAKQIKLYQN